MATISPRAAAGVLLRPFRPVAPPHQRTGQISSCSLNFFQGRRRKGGRSPCPRPRHPSIFLRRRLRVGDLWVSYGSREPSPGESGLEDRDPLPAEDVPFPEVHDPSVVGRDAADGEELGWLPAFPHALTASMANFLFGYHIGVMNGPIESIAKELGFEGNTFLQGLVVSIFIAGAFIGSISCGSLVGSLGCRRTLQIDTIPLIVGALLRWREMLYIASLPGLFLIFGMQFAVESPRWLYKVGRLDEAKRVIGAIWGQSEVDCSIEEIESVIKSDGTDSDSSWLELLVEPNKKVAFIGGSLFVLQQFAGINGVLYFSSLTFQDVGISSGALASLYVGITNFAGALCALLLMDKQGRQRLLIGSYLGMAFSMFLVVYAISFPVDEQTHNNLSILGTIMYIFTFAIGAGPVTGLIIPELSSARLRAKVMGFSFSVHWVCNFVVGLFFLELVERFGVSPVYAIFGGVSLLSAVFAAYFVVETKGRSLEEIEMSLNPSLRTEDK